MMLAPFRCAEFGRVVNNVIRHTSALVLSLLSLHHYKVFLSGSLVFLIQRRNESMVRKTPLEFYPIDAVHEHTFRLPRTP